MKARVRTFDYHQQLHTTPEKMIHFIRYSPNILYEGCTSPEHEIDLHAATREGWLANEDRYQFIRRLVLSNKIVAFTADITHHDSFQEIHQLLQDNGISVDTLYVSNVHNYIHD